MKRMLTAALALLLALSLCACGGQATDDTPTYPAAFPAWRRWSTPPARRAA